MITLQKQTEFWCFFLQCSMDLTPCEVGHWCASERVPSPGCNLCHELIFKLFSFLSGGYLSDTCLASCHIGLTSWSFLGDPNPIQLSFFFLHKHNLSYEESWQLYYLSTSSPYSYYFVFKSRKEITIKGISLSHFLYLFLTLLNFKYFLQYWHQFLHQIK